MASNTPNTCDSHVLERIARIVCACAFFTTLPIYSPNVMALYAFEVDAVVGPYVFTLMTASFVASCIIAILYSRASRFRVPFAVGVLLVALYMFGCIGFAVLLSFVPAWSGVAGGCFALITAIGLVPACCIWTHVFADLDLFGAIRLFALVTSVSVVCNLGIASIGGSGRYVVYVVLVILGVSWLFVHLFRRSATEKIVSLRTTGAAADGSAAGEAVCDPAFEENPGTLVEEGESRGVRIRPFLSVTGAPLLGMLISSFATGVQPVYVGNGALSAYHIGMIGAAIISLVLLAFKQRQPFYAFIYQAAVPILASCIVIVCALPVGMLPRSATLSIVTVFYSLVSVLALASACAIANAREFPRPFVFSVIISAFSGMSLLGLVYGGVINPDEAAYDSMIVVLTTAYCAWMLLHGCLKSWKGTADIDEDAPSIQISDERAEQAKPEQPTDSARDSFDQRMEKIASEGGLSPRETEIMGYVGRGHSSVFVAKTLLVSESTVYTHVRNIYRKLGVSSREELIQLLNDTSR